MAIEIRPARESEMGQLGLITGYVYGGSFGDGPNNVVAGANRPEWTMCAFDGDRMVASFSTIPFNMRALGRPVPLGGISAVGTLPEYRRRGIVRKIMTKTFEQLHDTNRPVAALWASQAAIYQRYGFALSSVMRNYQIDTVDIGFYDGDFGSCEVRRVSLEEHFDTIKQLYISFIERRMCFLHRSRALWQLGVLNYVEADGPVNIAVAFDGQTPVGYIVYTLRSGRVTHPSRNQQLKIRDLVHTTPDAYRSLWRFVASHDLVGNVAWDCAPVDDPAAELFTEPRLLNAKDNEGVWFRLVDIKGALENRGYIGSGELTFAVPRDDMAPWNEGVWKLTVDNGTASVAASSSPAQMTLSSKALVSLFSGYRPAGLLALAGLMEGPVEAITTATRIFMTPHGPHCPDHF